MGAGVMLSVLGFFTKGGLLGFIGKVLDFLKSPAGWLAIGFVIVMYARHDARQSEREMCNAETLAAEVQELRRQKKATQAVARIANDQAEQTLIENHKLEQRIRGYESQISTPGCVLGSDDLGRLPTRQ